MTDSERLDTTIRDALGLPPDGDLTDLAYGRSPGWDSVGHLQLVLSIEAAFGISLEGDDVMALSSYQHLRRVLSERHGLSLE